MINLLPEDIKKEEPKKKTEISKVEMFWPAKPKPVLEVEPEAKTAVKPEIKPEMEPEIKPEVATPSTKKGTNFVSILKQGIQKFVQNLTAKKKLTEEEAGDIRRPLRSFGPSAPEVTLMPEELPITKRMIQERILILLAVIVFSVLVVFMVWVWATWRFEVVQGEINRIKTDMATTEAQIISYNDLIKEVRALEQKAERISDLLNNHIYWTKFFKLLETYTIPDVYYGDFNGDTSGKIILPSVGRNLIAAARQLIALSNAPDFVQTVTITDLTGGMKGVTFNTNLILVPEVFKK